MIVKDYRRILDIVIEQCKADGCKDCYKEGETNE